MTPLYTESKQAINEPVWKTETESQTQRTGLWCQGGVWEGEGWTGYLSLTDTHYYTERVINNKAPCIVQNDIQSPGLNYNGKNILKECIYMYKPESIYVSNRDWCNTVNQPNFN